MKTVFLSIVIAAFIVFASSCGNETEAPTAPEPFRNVAAAPQLESGYEIGLEMSVEGVPSGVHPDNDRIVYLSAFGGETWVIHLKEDQDWPPYDTLRTVSGVYLDNTDLNTGERLFEILIDAEVE